MQPSFDYDVHHNSSSSFIHQQYGHLNKSHCRVESNSTRDRHLRHYFLVSSFSGPILKAGLRSRECLLLSSLALRVVIASILSYPTAIHVQ
jgi:hypothetical protein